MLKAETLFLNKTADRKVTSPGKTKHCNSRTQPEKETSGLATATPNVFGCCYGNQELEKKMNDQ